MKAGSGMSANPAEAEVSMAGLSPNRKSIASRAPEASKIAETIRREVSETRAPPLFRARARKAPQRSAKAAENCFSAPSATKWVTEPRAKTSVPRRNAPCAMRLLVTLMRRLWRGRRRPRSIHTLRTRAPSPVPQILEVLPQFGEAANDQQFLPRRSGVDLFMLQNPGVSMRHEDRV